jgi:hypothetical protein
MRNDTAEILNLINGTVESTVEILNLINGTVESTAEIFNLRNGTATISKRFQKLPSVGQLYCRKLIAVGRPTLPCHFTSSHTTEKKISFKPE